MSTQPNFSQNERLDFMDVLRGVAIILVVYSHLCVHVFEIDSDINHNLIRFRMPLFFFVSGFFACMPEFSQKKIKKRVANRITKQLWPTVVICIIFVIVTTWGRPVWGQLRLCLFDAMKRGYWFTYSLVEVFLVYAALAWTFGKLRLRHRRQAIIYMALALVMEVSYFILLDTFGPPAHGRNAVNLLSLHRTLNFGPFFFVGITARLYQQQFLKLLSSRRFVGITLSLLILAVVADYRYSRPELFALTSWLSLPIVIAAAYAFKDTLKPETRVGSTLIFFGKNTLPVYLFHYFIIFFLSTLALDGNRLLEALRQLHPLAGALTPLAEFITLTVMAILITALCILADIALRRLRPLHRLIFSG